MDIVRVLIIDDQDYFRAGVRQAISGQSDFNILDCNATDPLGMVEVYLPDVILLGSDLAARSALELARQISRTHPNSKVILLSPDPSDEILFEVIRAAAAACLHRKTGSEELVSTIRRTFQGEYPINDTFTERPIVAKRVLEQFQDIASMGKVMESVSAPLTNRETQILNYIAAGNANKEIAHILGISEQTIKSHISAILRKLNANDRAHAVALAISHGWLSMEDREEKAGNSLEET